MYFESLTESPIKKLLEDPAKALKSGSEIKFSERTYFHMAARLFYKLVRLFYVSIIYYFVPYIFFIIHW